MSMILGLLAMVATIASIVFWIMTLIVIFKKDEIVLGIIGIICSPVAFVVGWVKATEWNHKQIMIYWTIAVVVGIVLHTLAFVMAVEGSS